MKRWIKKEIDVRAERLFALLGKYDEYPAFDKCEDDIGEIVYFLMEASQDSCEPYTFDYEKVNIKFIWEILDGGMNSKEEVVKRITNRLNDIQYDQIIPCNETPAEMAGHGYWDFF